MDATVKKLRTAPQAGIGREPGIVRPSREEAEEAVRTLIAYAGDDPDREGLRETPRRVTAAYDEFFAGYSEDPLTNVVDVYIARLRRKIDTPGREPLLETVRGHGYRLRAPGHS